MTCPDCTPRLCGNVLNTKNVGEVATGECETYLVRKHRNLTYLANIKAIDQPLVVLNRGRKSTRKTADVGETLTTASVAFPKSGQSHCVV